MELDDILELMDDHSQKLHDEYIRLDEAAMALGAKTNAAVSGAKVAKRKWERSAEARDLLAQ